MISIVIPTYNESSHLTSLLPFLITHGGKYLDRIIIANSPESTELFDSYNSKVEIIKASKHQRATQLNEGAQKVYSPWIFFLHADTIPHESFMEEIVNAINHGAEAGCFAYKFSPSNIVLNINSYFTKYKGFFAGGGDQGLFISKKLFNQLGGYNQDLDLMEDFDLYDRINAVNSNFYISPKRATVSSRKYQINSWWKVNWVQLKVFVAYRMGFSQLDIKRIYSELKHPSSIR